MTEVALAGTRDVARPPFAFEAVQAHARRRGHWLEREPFSRTFHANWTMVLESDLRPYYWRPADLVFGAQQAAYEQENGVAIVQEATRFALDAYTGHFDGERLDGLARAIGRPAVARGIVSHRFDSIVLQASDPLRCKYTAIRLAARLTRPMLMLPLCKGGLAAGMQTFLYHQSLPSVTPNGELYPVYYSQKKADHAEPRLEASEIAHLRAAAADRQVVVFDDTAQSGQTLAEARFALSEMLQMPQDEIITAANVVGPNAHLMPNLHLA